MYILESKGVLKKSDYNALDKHLRDWRLDGYIKWEHVADGSGRSIINDHKDFQDPNTFVNNEIDFLKQAGKRFRDNLMKKWRWHSQPKYVTFMVEKHAITGTIDAYLKDHHVKIAYNRGNNGWGFAYRYVGRMRNELYYTDVDTGECKKREAVRLWYLGDDDKYGRHMDIEIKDQLAIFGVSNTIKLQRIAVTSGQEDEYGLIPSEDGGYEIDALNAFRPDLFEQLLLDHVEPYFDKDIHNKVMAKYPESEIDKVVRRKIKFIEEQNPGVMGTHNGHLTNNKTEEELEDEDS
jgi:hypothetical protein